VLLAFLSLAMLDGHTRNSLRTVSFFGYLALAVVASSCGHTQASPASAPAKPDAVMKMIQDYGRGHSGFISPASPTKPTETEDAYGAQMSDLLVHEDFVQLENIGRQNRTEKGRLVGGIWKTFAFYEGLSKASTTGQESVAFYDQQITRAKKWIAAYPDSVTARLALAELYLDYGGFARGTGTANTVSESQWNQLNTLSAKAKAILLEASTFKEKDPAWYFGMQLIALYEGWDKEKARELFDQATAFEPDYYHFYRQYANYLLPRWYGESGDVPALAEEVAKRIQDPQGSMLYFYIIGTITCYCREDMEELSTVSYAKVKQGYDSISRLYGTSNLNANRFAFIAVTFKDQASARVAFEAISETKLDIWYTQGVFDTYLNWAYGH
jgi:tetratricopeptide (TPR) repeat protein